MQANVEANDGWQKNDWENVLNIAIMVLCGATAATSGQTGVCGCVVGARSAGTVT